MLSFQFFKRRQATKSLVSSALIAGNHPSGGVDGLRCNAQPLMAYFFF